MRSLKDYFYRLFDDLLRFLQPEEELLVYFLGEESEFIRLNQSKVRQAGSVYQLELSIDLIRRKRSASAQCNIAGDINNDTKIAKTLISTLRNQCSNLDEDPYLLVKTDIENSEFFGKNELPQSDTVVQDILASVKGLDLVGLYASGTIYRGFANSYGQRNWYEKSSFNFDWSCFHHTDKAVKSRYAGFSWSNNTFNQKIEQVHQEIEILSKPSKTIKPGCYRSFLAPAAVQELFSTLSWESFGIKSYNTRRSPLLKLADGDKNLDSRINLIENNATSLTPTFTRTGFLKPTAVKLIEDGRSADFLVSPRSAKQYDLPVTANNECPQSLELDSGKLCKADVVEHLETGLYINNLWYLNFSDRNNCRITGMTRYACFWVENGQIHAPLNAMRFDDSLYQMLGPNLLGLTQERELIADTDTYERRSVGSMRLPGLLIDRLHLTL